MSSSISLIKLSRAFASDKKATKELSKIFHYANALECWLDKRDDATRNAAKDRAILELREALGEEHFARVADRVMSMIRKGERHGAAR